MLATLVDVVFGVAVVIVATVLLTAYGRFLHDPRVSTIHKISVTLMIFVNLIGALLVLININAGS